MKRFLQEGVLVAVIGVALAFASNALSPRGLQLSKNYFPATKPTSPAPVAATNLPGATTAKTNSPLELLSARLRENGLQLADSNHVMQIFGDPRREQDLVIFIDARDDEHYGAGHIPGAYQFDRFHPENYLANVIPVCQSAQQIVFYCNGGECDDSEFAAIMLRDSISLPPEKLFVYGGGITEWAAKGLPIELGLRNSGQITNLVTTTNSVKAADVKK
ncbi:MAG: rhodanese-like domain-containing protein [Verrucomicrobia bacterium]|nr:rhodanese-like domain-containing protein [Verrucomicrobiota bacterium]